MNQNFNGYLTPTSILDSDNKDIIEYALKSVKDCGNDPVKKAVALFYSVRDDIWYDPYSPFYKPEHYLASNILKKRRGFCISKAGLLCTLGRTCGIPSRVGFATVKNHLATRQLLEHIGTNIFIYHGYTEFYLDNRWVKATPTFNKELCEKHNVPTLEFNGLEDAVFQSYNSQNSKFMEYQQYHGTYADIPVDTIVAEWKKGYGEEKVNMWIKMFEAFGGSIPIKKFEKEEVWNK